VAYTSEIEKLEARYRENPKGRNFAPLADAYRKAALIDNAIELCQTGLQLHPDYVSGHIVHGRCLVDKKDDSGAESVFRRVLDLDPENILALKVLAEIAERNERFATAAEWLNRLLLADPMNGEAAEGLSRVRHKAAAQAPEPAPEEPVASMLLEAETPLEVEHEELEVGIPSTKSPGPSAQSPHPRISVEYMEGPFDAAMADATTAAMGRPEFEVERTSEPPPTKATEPVTSEIETYDGTVDFTAVAADALVPDGIQIEEPAALMPEAEIEKVEIEGLARTQYEGSGLFKLDQVEPETMSEPGGATEALEERTTSPMTDLPLILPDDVESPALRAFGSGARAEYATAPSVAAAPPPPPMRLPDDDGAADAATLSQAEPVVTETMAELYLQQGHQEDALRVYEALSAQRPHDSRLRQKVAELAAPRLRPSGSGQSAGTFLKGILNARPGTPPPPAPPPPPPPPPPPAAEPVAPLDQALDQSAGEAPSSAAAQGSPTRPASDAISLDSVFGEEGGRGSIPALPEQVPEKPSKLPAATGGFSFDDFFGTASAPAGGTGKGSTPNARPPRSSGGGRARGAEPEDDLDQFQAWLKSLKA
jgi:tetratricopeptide (TPR) repeat protein